jgi:NAD(P)-dependent dehydrogenase (short-subunit alcohol dehydrogenase family)
MASETIALVTGANKGIGEAIARQLAGLGLTVLVGARDPELGAKAAEAMRGRAVGSSAVGGRVVGGRAVGSSAVGGRAVGGRAHAITIDVTDAASIQAAREQIDRLYGRLDVLVNNAGIAGGSEARTPGKVNLDNARAVLETNLIGVIAVTDTMLPLLRRSASPRIVNVSSGTGSLHHMTDPDHYFAGIPASAIYPASKTALNALTVQYAKALAADGILVNAIAPGACATDFLRDLDRVVTRTADEGARIAVRMATLPEGGPTGGFFDDDGPVPW